MRTHAPFPRPNLPPVHSAQAFAARNLYLLSAIENTLDALHADTGLMVSIERTYDEIHQMLIDAAQELTDEGIRLCLAPVEKAGDTVSRRWCEARDKRAAAFARSQCRADDSVVQAWQHYMDACYSLHEKIETVRNWLEDVHACMQPHGDRVFTDVDEMVAHIMAEP